MLALITAAQEAFNAPYLDYHALAPEIALTAVLVTVLLVDLFIDPTRRHVVAQLAGLGTLAALVPVATLALAGTDGGRSMFGGAYVVDDFSLVLKGLFLLTGYVVILISTNYIEEGDYHQGEYYVLLLSSLLGMVVMSSSRDLITIFVALELLSIPAYLLAGWRKSDTNSNEASLKYYLLGVLASAVMLYGMSLVFGLTGTTVLSEIGATLATGLTAAQNNLAVVGIFLVIVGFAFKVSAVPFHFWAPDTYEGAPTPVTAFLSVASKTAGFVALLQLVFVGFYGQTATWGFVFWVLAALTMTVGNLIALRQSNIVRMLAYSSVAQAGYILVPFATAAENRDSFGTAATAAIVYLIIYAAMNLGAFAIVIAVGRKTQSGDISSYGGLFTYAPGLTVLMSVFLFSLAGIPPLGGWFAKFYIFNAAAKAGTVGAITLAVIVAVNSVIALFYYANVARQMWMNPVPDGDTRRVEIQPALGAALVLCAVFVVIMGVNPGTFGDLGNLASNLVR